MNVFLKPSTSSEFLTREFRNVDHTDPKKMKGLTFFLGSSSSGFKAINGYYSKAILYTNKGCFVTNAAGAQKVQNSRGDPHSFNPAKLVEKVADKTKALKTL